MSVLATEQCKACQT